MSLVTKVLAGMSVIGSIMSPVQSETELAAKAQTMAHVLSGLHDENILCAMFSTYTKNVPTDLEVVKSDPQALEALGRLKEMIRREIQMVLEKGAAEDMQNLLAKMKDTNKPHPMGTVSEIATKLNISKSEVRRMKSNGTLDGMVMISGEA